MAQQIRIQPKSPDKGIPETPHNYLVVKDFAALNTKADRTAIKENEFSWIENIMPQGFGNLQSIPNYSIVNGVNWSNPVSNAFPFTMTSSGSFSGNHDMIMAFETNGAVELYDQTSGSIISVAGPGTLSSSGVTASMWSNTTLMILDPNNGLYSFMYGQNLVPIGSVGLIVITNPGSAYTSPPSVSFSSPSTPNGIRAQGIALITSGVVTSVILTEPGSGYTSPPSITINGGGGTGATASCSLISFKRGIVSAITVTSGGTNYTSAPTVAITGGGGTGASAIAVIDATSKQVVQVLVTNGGSGYNGTPITITFTGGGGSGAAATGVIQSDANVAVATFSSRVWVASGRTISFTAADSNHDFITVSAGSLTINDSTLRGNIIQLYAANNFLYIFGIDSIYVISDVSVTTTGTTLFTNTVVSSSIGTSFPFAIFNYYRSVLFMNQYGVYALVGATTSKISDPLDGILSNIDFTRKITCGQVTINNQICAVFNVFYRSPIVGENQRYIQLVFFEKKWFISSQDDAIDQIVPTQTSGNLLIFGTKDLDIVQLYADESTSGLQTIKTALSGMEDVMKTKQTQRYAVELRTGIQGVILDVTVDNENTSSSADNLFNAVDWINNQNMVVKWVNNSAQIVKWLATGYQYYQHDAKQYGKYVGLTITSQSPGMVITGFQMEYILRERFK